MWFLIVFAAAFLVTYAITPIFIKKLMGAGITGNDVHKKEKAKVPEMGGLVILFGLSAGIFVSIPFFHGNIIHMFAALLSIMIMGFIGICDDLFGIKFRKKALLPVFASVPLIMTTAGTHSMNIPFIGMVDFGLLYPILIIPLAMTISSNAYNMLAGYNGLEVGLGFISCVFVGLAGIILGKPEVFVLMLAVAGSCLAFLRYNYFPARIFPGDIGTFILGASIAAAAIVGNMEMFGLIVLGPQIINGVITVADIFRKRPIQRFSTLDDEGRLVPPEKGHLNTLYFLIEKMVPVTEKELVWIIWAIGIIFGLVALTLVL